ncbi:MAG: hypothetical protein K0R15_1983 [Clostridiales bacterium]|nr:hypothetical protein [Clostridiales bacterium]
MKIRCHFELFSHFKHIKDKKSFSFDINQVCDDSNEKAWNNLTYEAWVNKFGSPEEAAVKLRNNPEKFLSIINEKIPQIKGSKIANLMGSNGTKSVALALLGADATVIDFSEGNKRYALELAESAGVNIRYLMENVIALPESELTRTTAKIRKHKVDGDYFDTSLVESQISFAKYMPEGETQKVYLRKWNLGEIVTAVAQSGLIITSLTEEPNFSCPQYDKGIPKTFTLTAKKGSL